MREEGFTDLTDKELTYISEKTLGQDLVDLADYRPSKIAVLQEYEISLGEGELTLEEDYLERLAKWLTEMNKRNRN